MPVSPFQNVSNALNLIHPKAVRDDLFRWAMDAQALQIGGQLIIAEVFAAQHRALRGDHVAVNIQRQFATVTDADE